MIRSKLQRFTLASALFGPAVSSTALADLTDAVATHTTVTATDFGGAEFTVHVVDLYLLADSEADRLMNVYNFSIACAAPFYQSFGAPGWCVQGKGPFNDCTPADSFITIGGIGSHDHLPRQCDFDRSCSCTKTDLPNPDPPSGWFNSNPAGSCGAVVQTPVGLAVFIGRFVSTTPFTLDGTTLEATWNQGLGTEGRQAAFVVTSPIDADGDCLPDPDCDGNGISDATDILRNPSIDCDADGLIDFCELGFEFDPVLRVHDNVAEDVVGSKGQGGTLGWFEAFGPLTHEFSIASVGVDFGIPGAPGPVLDGSPASIAIWTDNVGNGHPADATLLASTDLVLVDSVDTGFQKASFDPPAVVPAGTTFFVGAVMDIPADSYPAAADTSGGSTGSWVAFDPAGFEVADVGSARDLGRLVDFGLDWRWMITATAVVEPGPDDCNGNAILDSCDIAGGTEDDDNGNGVPDVCESLEGDLDLDGCVDARDLGLLIALWGTLDPPLGDLDGDGVIGPGDLGRLLSAWSPCDP